jgi:hypothetical protein
MRLAGVMVLVTLCSVQAGAQGVIFADGFELGRHFGVVKHGPLNRPMPTDPEQLTRNRA